MIIITTLITGRIKRLKNITINKYASATHSRLGMYINLLNH